jgi:hypothetical protein
MADDAARAMLRLGGDATAQAHLSGLNDDGGTPRAVHQALTQWGAWCNRARVCSGARDGRRGTTDAAARARPCGAQSRSRAYFLRRARHSAGTCCACARVRERHAGFKLLTRSTFS